MSHSAACEHKQQTEGSAGWHLPHLAPSLRRELGLERMSAAGHKAVCHSNLVQVPCGNKQGSAQSFSWALARTDRQSWPAKLGIPCPGGKADVKKNEGSEQLEAPWQPLTHLPLMNASLRCVVTPSAPTGLRLHQCKAEGRNFFIHCSCLTLQKWRTLNFLKTKVKGKRTKAKLCGV